jgi:hypothetical protein
VNAGDPAGEKVVDAYNIVYGPESGRNIHAGLDGVDGHLLIDGVSLSVKEVRDEPDLMGMIVWAGVLVAVFAKHIFERHDLSTDAIDGLGALSPHTLLGTAK